MNEFNSINELIRAGSEETWRENLNKFVQLGFEERRREPALGSAMLLEVADLSLSYVDARDKGVRREALRSAALIATFFVERTL